VSFLLIRKSAGGLKILFLLSDPVRGLNSFSVSIKPYLTPGNFYDPGNVSMNLSLICRESRQDSD
jgi:hypothetical protein